jgi:hypothetical protein
MPTDRLPGKIKLLYETSAAPGGWERAVTHGRSLALKRQTDTFVDYRPRTRTWVAWSWAHHASPRVIDLAEIVDAHGRYGLTYVGPDPAGPKPTPGHRRDRHGDLTVTDVLGRQREAPKVWSDGSYTCPFCSYPVSPADKSCQNPACAAGPHATPERVRAAEQRKREEASREASRQAIRNFQKKYAEDTLREKLARQARLTAEATQRGACLHCLGKTSVFQTGHGTPKFVRHRGRCPFER